MTPLRGGVVAAAAAALWLSIWAADGQGTLENILGTKNVKEICEQHTMKTVF